MCILFLKGPPVFASYNELFKDRNKESEIKIRVNLYSSYQITCHDITEVGGTSLTREVDVKLRPVRIKEMFHGAIVTLNGTEIIFVLNGLNADRFHSYNITVCNIYGQSSVVISSKSIGMLLNETRFQSYNVTCTYVQELM